MVAAAELDIFVPVLGRPGHARPFVASLRSTVAIRKVAVLAIASRSDDKTINAWLSAGADVMTVPDELGSYAHKVNAAFTHTSAPSRAFRSGAPAADWMLLLGDDVEFQAGWFESLQAIITANPDARVIGTNDFGFERDGMSTVHPAIHRGYVDDIGASFDGPGTVCHTGYHHHYVDAEIRAKAEREGVFVNCKYCTIVHLHHVFGRAPVDATYELGVSRLHEDRALFWARYEAFTATLGP